MKTLFSLLALMVFMTACQSNAAQNTGNAKTIVASEYQKLMGQQTSLVLIDVRTPEEFAEGHLANAVNINFNGSDFKQKIGALDKSKTTFVYCLSGGRSNSAMNEMSEMGFREVYNLQGGILQWKANNLPLAGAAANNAWKGMTKADYEKLISGKTPVLVDFNAKWCGPCKQLKPILAEIEKEYAGKVKVVAIDIDENKSLAEALYVRNIPLLIYHENGEPKINQEGFIEKADLIKLLHLH
jgi:thioredoxin